MGIVFLEIRQPGQTTMLGGFLIIDRKDSRVYVRTRPRWPQEIKGDTRTILKGLGISIEEAIESQGIEKGLETIDGWSHLVQPTNEFAIAPSVSPDALADELARLLFQ